jgi:hypothetical protein
MNSAGAVFDRTRLHKEADNFLTLESAVTPWSNAGCPYSALITPAPQGVRMDMQELSNLRSSTMGVIPSSCSFETEMTAKALTVE